MSGFDSAHAIGKIVKLNRQRMYFKRNHLEQAINPGEPVESMELDPQSSGTWEFLKIFSTDLRPVVGFWQHGVQWNRLPFGNTVQTAGCDLPRTQSDGFADDSVRVEVPIVMQNVTRFPDSTPDELPRELIELGKRIAALPEPHYRELEDPYSQVVDCLRRRRRILNLVQEALAQLRLDVKYLMFDVEITKQERDALRAQLDEIERDDYGSSW